LKTKKNLRHYTAEAMTPMPTNTLSFVFFADDEHDDIDARLLKSPEPLVEQNLIEEDDDFENESVTTGSDHSTVDDRRQREEEQSIELARQLMAEEALMSYQQHYNFLQDSANEYSQEDFTALQNALDDEEDEVGAEFENNEGDLSYETMLYLGERIGDVKTERWTMIANREFEKLPTFNFSRSIQSEMDVCKDADDSENKCLICQCEYEIAEQLSRLPCDHCFHTGCVRQWLTEKDCCPYCRQSITKLE
jgi:Ring finger domain